MTGAFSIFLASLLAALATAGCAWYGARVTTQITYVTLADGRRQERRLPLLFRLLLPLAPNLTAFFARPRFAAMRQAVTPRLIAGGYEGLLTAEEFLALRVWLLVGVGGLGSLLLGLGLRLLPPGPAAPLLARQGLLYLLLAAWAFAYPLLWLRQAVRLRHHAIELALPFVLDLLTLSVEAGLDFMTAIKRIIDRRRVDALAEELIRMFREVQVGRTRREALRDMAERSGQEQLQSLVHALVQADELGVSIGAILRIQADLMRQRRFLRAETIANEAPVKMLFPLVTCIFPAVFLVLLAPILLQFLRHGF